MIGLSIPPGPDVLRLSDLRRIVYRRMGITPDRQVLVLNGRLLRGSDSQVLAEANEGLVVETYGHPPDDYPMPVRTTFGGETVDSIYEGEVYVSDLKRFLARRFQLAPCRQVLTTLEVTMEEEHLLAAYKARDCIEVALAVRDVDEEWPAQPVSVLVHYRDLTGCASFCLDAQDTFDVLLGKLEDARLVDQGEQVTLFAGNTVFQQWRTLGHYRLTSPAEMWILEDLWE